MSEKKAKCTTYPGLRTPWRRFDIFPLFATINCAFERSSWGIFTFCLFCSPLTFSPEWKSVNNCQIIIFFSQSAAPEREKNKHGLICIHAQTAIPAAASGFQWKRASLSLICLFDAAQRLQQPASQFHFSTREVTEEDDERRSEGSKFDFFFSSLLPVLGDR